MQVHSTEPQRSSVKQHDGYVTINVIYNISYDTVVSCDTVNQYIPMTDFSNVL